MANASRVSVPGDAFDLITRRLDAQAAAIDRLNRRLLVPTHPIYDPTSLPDDPVETQIAFHGDDPFYYKNGVWLPLGGGIRFDTDPQVGDWLVAEVTDLEGYVDEDDPHYSGGDYGFRFRADGVPILIHVKGLGDDLGDYTGLRLAVGDATLESSGLVRIIGLAGVSTAGPDIEERTEAGSDWSIHSSDDYHPLSVTDEGITSVKFHEDGAFFVFGSILGDPDNPNGLFFTTSGSTFGDGGAGWGYNPYDIVAILYPGADTPNAFRILKNVDDSPLFVIDADGVIHGLASVGAIAWDL